MLYPFKVYRAISNEDNKNIFWIAESLSLKGCISEGKTIEKAIEGLSSSEIEWLKIAQEKNIEIPNIPITKI